MVSDALTGLKKHNTQPDQTRHRQSRRDAEGGEFVSKPVGSGKWLLMAGIGMKRSLSREQVVNSKN